MQEVSQAFKYLAGAKAALIWAPGGALASLTGELLASSLEWYPTPPHPTPP